MKKKQEIWFFDNSTAARLAKPLRQLYALRSVDSQDAAIGAGPECSATAVWLADPASGRADALRKLARRNARVRLIAVVDDRIRGRATGRTSKKPAGRAAHRVTGRVIGSEWFAYLPSDATADMVRHAVAGAFSNIALAARERDAREELARAEREREELNRIGVALSATHDVDALLETILAKTREITGADAGSLYLVETVRPQNGASSAGAAKPGESPAGNSEESAPERRLRFKATQNDSRQFPFVEYTLPITEDSLAGYAALHGEVIALDNAYALPKSRPYRFNPRYDDETGYRTCSLLTVPMKDARGEVIGVVQLLNCKRDPKARLSTPPDLDREVQPFPARAVHLAESLASQAAVAYENSRLYQDIESLFEGFVQAAVTAIEQRDPTTSGHSLRVSQMTVGLAEIVDRCDSGLYRGTKFTRDQMKEIRYAGLLHDFGKLGVREEVLVKAKKLYPSQFDIVQTRFDYVRKELEAYYEGQKVRLLLNGSRENAVRKIAELDEELRRRLAAMDDAFGKIADANEPTVLAAGEFEQLFEIARQTYRDPRGVERPMLTDDEVRFLSIEQGSLDPVERQQVESHVVHSFNFLMQIPWTREIRRISEIARAHHEKMNGTGYPYRLKGEEIPIQARMMTICDIFDALSAADRPYKKAVPPERALGILEDAVVKRELDPDLFQLFLQARIYDMTDKIG